MKSAVRMTSALVMAARCYSESEGIPQVAA
jgi:hypothetical protein